MVVDLDVFDVFWYGVLDVGVYCSIDVGVIMFMFIKVIGFFDVVGGYVLIFLVDKFLVLVSGWYGIVYVVY